MTLHPLFHLRPVCPVWYGHKNAPPHLSSTHVGNHKQEIPARSISQCNRSSPTSVVTRNIGHLQTTLKPKILSFWLLFAIAPNNRIKKLIKMPPLSIRTAQVLPATQTIRPLQFFFVFHFSFANKHRNDTVGETTNQS